ncbi:MAG: hypothetical protein M3323_08880, partial [Actinomycetota bacterium]|nr:hypothetical protein [Actinomycetota bacterium]
MTTSADAAARSCAAAAGVAAFGLLATVTVGAVVTAGTDLLLPDVLSIASPGEALAHSVRLGLAGLRVPLRSGEVTGNAAPLTGAVAAVWAITAATRRRTRGGGSRALQVGSVGASFAALCALAAGLTGGPDAGASPAWAAAMGLAWG